MKILRGGSRTAATSKMERFVIIVNGWKPLTIITKRSILDVAAALDPLLILMKGLLRYFSAFNTPVKPSKYKEFRRNWNVTHIYEERSVVLDDSDNKKWQPILYAVLGFTALLVIFGIIGIVYLVKTKRR